MVRMTIQYNDGRADGMVFRPVLIRGNDIKKKIDLGKGYSAMVMSDGVVIPIKVELTRLIDILDRNVGTNGYVDLSNLTGPAAEGAPDFSILNGTLKVNTPLEEEKIEFDPDKILIKIWDHDENCKRYQYRELYSGEIESIRPMPGYKNRVWLKVKNNKARIFSTGHKVYGFSRFMCADIDPQEFVRLLNAAKRNKTSVLNLADETSSKVSNTKNKAPLRPK